tara:strand:+ start:95 stop:790 length:696 start_codon:yes stop_codon:yes gene_type:complete
MKVKDLRKLIEEAYVQVLREGYDPDQMQKDDEEEHGVAYDDDGRPLGEAEEPTPEDPIGDEKASEETVLEDATDTMLEKFPTLKLTLVKLMTKDFKQFVDTVDWVSPKPTTFRVNLVNGQDFTLKWLGKNFQAQILGKKYMLGNISEFQQALDKLARLYQEAPLKGAGEEGEGGEAGEADFGGGGGGDFPGEEGGGEAGGEAGFDDGGADAGGEDLGDAEVDFEAGEEPEA